MRKLLTILLLTFAVPYSGAALAAQQAEEPRAQKKQQKAETKQTEKKRRQADAGRNRAKKSRSQSSRRSSKSSALTPGREAAALTFARLHHPELAELLTTLKRKRRNQYDRALRQLFQSSERLARLRERFPERYELSLEAWQLDSRIRLLAARMTMKEDSQLEQQLADLVQSRTDVRLRQLKLDRNRLVERLKRVDGLIEKYSTDPDAATRRELQRIKRSFVARKRTKRKPAQRAVTAPTPQRTKSRPDGKSKNPL